MIKKFEDFLLEKNGPWGLSLQQPIKYFMNNNYYPHGTTLLIFWFKHGGRYPVVVTKLSTDPSLLENEYMALSTLQAVHISNVPRPLHFGVIEGLNALWMTGAPGLRLHPGDHRVSSYISRLVDCLLDLHQRIRCESALESEERVRKILQGPFESLERYGARRSVRERYWSLEPALRRFLMGVVPSIPQHGDLFLGNVLRHKEDFYFVDWEIFKAIDIPFFDLFTLLISILLGFGDNPRSWPSRLTRRIPVLVRRYASRLGLVDEMSHPALLLTLINWFHLQYIGGWHSGAQKKCELLEKFFDNEQSWSAALLGV